MFPKLPIPMIFCFKVGTLYISHFKSFYGKKASWLVFFTINWKDDKLKKLFQNNYRYIVKNINCEYSLTKTCHICIWMSIKSHGCSCIVIYINRLPLNVKLPRLLFRVLKGPDANDIRNLHTRILNTHTSTGLSYWMPHL